LTQSGHEYHIALQGFAVRYLDPKFDTSFVRISLKNLRFLADQINSQSQKRKI